uniref:Uncharacterized protein n=1 Tax=Timema poppense TaxID=170557 RepID=A0A7R9HD22_TIMPO|nr:unnamed protein product [Timema poppensis]
MGHFHAAELPQDMNDGVPSQNILAISRIVRLNVFHGSCRGAHDLRRSGLLLVDMTTIYLGSYHLYLTRFLCSGADWGEIDSMFEGLPSADKRFPNHERLIGDHDTNCRRRGEENCGKEV